MFSKNYAQTHKRNNVLTFLIMIPLLALIGWGISKWSEPTGSHEIQTGQRIIYQMAGSQTLDKAGFFDAYPDGRPSDFVSFVQSRHGQKLWPSSQRAKNDVASPSYRDDNRLRKPADLTFAAHERTTWDRPQVVYIPDDANQQLLLHGYDPGHEEPMYEYDFDFPTDAGEIPLD
ncbi:MAG: hypothetical protein ACQEVA_18830 [Myxococcota bacterium]